MPENKIKTENYQNLGGINSKVSPFLQGPQEFLSIINFDFQTPGSLSTRWGSTQYIASSASFVGQVTSLFEYEKLNGISQVLFSFSGGIWVGATTGAQQGLSFGLLGATFALVGGNVFAPTAMPTDYIAGQFQAYAVEDVGGGFGLGVFPIYGGVGASQIPFNVWANDVSNPVTATLIPQNINGSNLLDYSVLNNYLFMADGQKFVKYEGTTLTTWATPPVLSYQSLFYSFVPRGTDYSMIRGVSLDPFYYMNGMTSGFSGTPWAVNPDFWGLETNYQYYLYASYVNNRGYETQPYLVAAIDLNVSGPTLSAAISGIAQGGSLGQTKNQFFTSLLTPTTAGISAIRCLIYRTTGNTFFIPNQHGFPVNLTDGFAPFFLYDWPASGSTFTNVGWGTINPGAPGTTIISASFVFSGTPYLATDYTNPSYFGTTATPFIPRYLETYNNQLMMAGFSFQPSTIWFSDIGEPEGVSPEDNIEVRTNDGDVIRGLKAYNSKFYIFKTNSFHELSGSDPSNFLLREVSDQYGCLSNRAVATYNDNMVFLDRKGIMLFNGANITCLSDRIQPIFDKINLGAARDVATMAHDKAKNQIVLGMPINGATLNNVTIVYDYLMNAFTTYEGYNPSVFSIVKGRLDNRTLLYGGYSGMFLNFGASLIGDNGIGFTSVVQTRYLSPMGQSVTEQFRRLYLNVDASSGATIPFQVEAYPNYGTSLLLNRTLNLTNYQPRMEFGIPAKSLSFKFSHFGITQQIKLHGWVVESRMQRMV